MSRPTRPHFRLLLLPALIALSLGGCATREYVDTEFGGVHQRMQALEALMNQATKTLASHSERLVASEGRVAGVEQTAAALGKRVEQNGAALAGVEQRLQGVDARVEAAGKRLDAHQAELAGNAKTVANLTGQVRDLGEGLANANRKAEAGAAHLAATQSRLGALESSLSAQAEASRAQAAAEAARVSADKAAAASLAAQTATAAPAPRVQVQEALAATPAQAVQTAAAVPAAPVEPAAPLAGTVDVTKRLDHMALLIGEVHKRIDVNSSTLSTTADRVDRLESRLTAADKRDMEQEAAIKAGGEKAAQVVSRVTAGEQRLGEQAQAIDKAGKQLEAVNAGLAAARVQMESDAKTLASAGQKIVALEQTVKTQDERLTKAEQEHGQLSLSAREALDRAVSAGRLAEGKLVMESVLTEDVGGFRVYRAQLSDGARKALDEFAARLKQENKTIYVEVQGHTDSSGTTKVNHKLSRQRAETVQEYLTKVAGLPVHRVGVVAYGATRPLADNDTPEGRAKNRRVDLVVLK